ncbi:HPGDS-like protein, partial [Mya arenaria]
MCHVCTSATDLSSCQATTMCTAGQVCFTEVSHMGNTSVYSMGCSDLQQCGPPVGSIMGPVIGRSVDARQAAAPYCHNCCTAPGCNLNICKSGNDTYRLFYFDFRGRGELTRMIFKYMDQPFTDIRINFQDWPAIKYSIQ